MGTTEELLHLLQQSRRKKISGGGILIYALSAILLLSLCMYMSYRYLNIRDQAKGIENSIATSLLGASRINMAEYGKTHQIVIHENLPERYRLTLSKTASTTAEMYIPNHSQYFQYYPQGALEFSPNDLYLSKSQSKFKELLKINLDLDDNMIPNTYSDNGKILGPNYYDDASNSVQPNYVTIEEYTIINKYSYRDSAPPYNKHTYTVVYRSDGVHEFTIVPALSGIDKVTRIQAGGMGWENVVAGGKCDGITVSETSAYVRMHFYTNLGKDITGKSRSVKQTVDRVVTIREK